ncbi:MAG: rod shape-determining protein [bacterium]
MWKFLQNKKIGIDLGTANTVVFTLEGGIVVDEPTIVAIDQVNKKIEAIGHDAKAMIGKTPESVRIYRPLQDGAIADYRTARAVLKSVIDKAVGKNYFFKPDAIVSVPAGITSTERRAVIEATRSAGARSVVLVKEPILAALGAGVPINEAKGHMLVDIGGGTTDVAVISLGGVVASTSVKCAGTKIDQAIIDYIRKKYSVVIGDRTAEDIKKRIASALIVVPDVRDDIKGRDMHTGLPKTITISTNELAEVLAPQYQQIVKAIKDVLSDTPAELASDIIDYGIVMTGGSSQLQNLSELIKQQTGVSVRVADEPLYAVAKGTGILLAHLDDYQRSILTKR